MLKKKEGITEDDIKTCTVELEKEENADGPVEEDNDEESVYRENNQSASPLAKKRLLE